MLFFIQDESVGGAGSPSCSLLCMAVKLKQPVRLSLVALKAMLSEIALLLCGPVAASVAAVKICST